LTRSLRSPNGIDSCKITSMGYAYVRVRGPRTLHLCCRLPPTNIQRQHIPSTATKQHSKLQELSRCRKQIPSIVTCGSKTSFLPCKEKDKLLHLCKMSKHSRNTCKHYRMFSCLSLSVVFGCLCSHPSQTLPRHVRSTLTTSYGSRINGPFTYLVHVAIVTARVG